MEKGKRTFTAIHLAYYAKTLGRYEPEIMFGIQGGEYHGEMAMRWYELGANSVPRLEAYCDAWATLTAMPDLLEYLKAHDDEDITPKEFMDALLALGFHDETDYTDPIQVPKETPEEELARLRKENRALRKELEGRE